MKDLKTLANMDSAQFERLVLSFPSSATINRSAIDCAVLAPNGETVLSAKRRDDGQWDVRAVPGLIIKRRA